MLREDVGGGYVIGDSKGEPKGELRGVSSPPDNRSKTVL